MIKHIVLLEWKDGTKDEQIDQVSSGLAELKEQIPGIVSYRFGRDAAIYSGNADYALIAEFQTEDDFKAYVVHPKHQAFLREVTGPILESFHSVQLIEE